jgi:hypothetical protein
MTCVDRRERSRYLAAEPGSRTPNTQLRTPGRFTWHVKRIISPICGTAFRKSRRTDVLVRAATFG